MNRRSFLGLAVTGLASYVLGKDLHQMQKDAQVRDLYDHGQDYLHLIEVKATVQDMQGNEGNIERKGYGIVHKGHYLTANHITDCSFVPIQTPIGTMEYPLEVKQKTATLAGMTLEEKCCDRDMDIAIFNLPKCHGLKELDYAPCLNPYLGQHVLLIGNPHLNGFITRQGHIVDLDGFEGQAGYVGMDIPVIPGDSGCCVVTPHFELVGLAVHGIQSLSYATKIGNFIDRLEG